MKDKQVSNTAIGFVGIAALLTLLCSCISFDISDWPSRFVYPHNAPPSNWCGSIGAFCAYYLLYYFGPGVFVLLASVTSYLVAKLSHRNIGQLIFRAIGVLLLTVAASSSFYCLLPYRVYGFPMGSGGVLGVGTVVFLQNHLASLGTFILIAATWIVGTVLLADSAILVILRWFGLAAGKMVGATVPAWSAAKQQSEVLGEIWQKLSAKAPTPAPLPPPRFESKVSSTPETVKVQSTQPKFDKPGKSYVPPSYNDYKLPPLELLAEPEHTFAAVQEKVVKAKAAALEKLLSEFNILARVVSADTGPVVTMFELELAAGVKVSQISTLSNDMARALGVGAVRVVAPLPGKHTIGIEVPNTEKEKVRIKDIMQLSGSRPERMEIPLFLGQGLVGRSTCFGPDDYASFTYCRNDRLRKKCLHQQYHYRDTSYETAGRGKGDFD